MFIIQVFVFVRPASPKRLLGGFLKKAKMRLLKLLWAVPPLAVIKTPTQGRIGQDHGLRRFVSSCDASVQGTKENKEKAIMLLDIDGVINMLGPQVKKAPKWTNFKSSKINGYPFHWSPTVVDKLNEWTDDNLVEVRWLTTWDMRAQTFVTPALALRNFSLARDPALNLSKLFAATRIAQAEPNRPIVWIDDDMASFFKPTDMENISYWMRREKTMLVVPNALMGLEPEDLEAIEKFLRNPTSVENNFDLTARSSK